MSPSTGARLLGGGRVAVGAGLLMAPNRVGRGWLGDHVDRPAVRAVVRSVGIRDLVLGMIAIHTVDHPEVGPRWQATCAAVDCVDLLATVAARDDLPGRSVLTTTAIASLGMAAGLYFSRALKLV